MEEEKKSFKLPHVPYNALISIEVSGVFLKRCQLLLIGLCEQLGTEKVKQLYEKFAQSDQNPANPTEAIIFILTALVSEIEKQAIEQKKVEEKEISMEDAQKMFGNTI